MEINVSNMPMNTLYKFDNTKYVWKTKLMETRGGTHKQDVPFDATEVYEITDKGYINLVASGKLNLNPQNNQEFEIYDYDKDKSISFHVPMHLEEMKLKDLWELRDAIAKNYRKNGK